MSEWRYISEAFLIYRDDKNWKPFNNILLVYTNSRQLSCVMSIIFFFRKSSKADNGKFTLHRTHTEPSRRQISSYKVTFIVPVLHYNFDQKRFAICFRLRWPHTPFVSYTWKITNNICFPHVYFYCSTKMNHGWLTTSSVSHLQATSMENRDGNEIYIPSFIILYIYYVHL